MEESWRRIGGLEEDWNRIGGGPGEAWSGVGIRLEGDRRRIGEVLGNRVFSVDTA